MVSTGSRKIPLLTGDTPVTYLKGVGPKKAAALATLQINTLSDFLYHFPRRYLDRSTITPINQLRVGMDATVVGRVCAQRAMRTQRREYWQLELTDGTGRLHCVWFNAVPYIKKVFQVNDLVAVSGKVEFFNGLQLVHPDYDILENNEWDATLHTARIIALYPATAELKRVGMDSRGFRRVLHVLFSESNFMLTEVLPQALRSEIKLPDIATAIKQIHFPDTLESLATARQRFKFEELFYLQLLLSLRRASIKNTPKTYRYTSAGSHLKTIYAKLPFQLTEAQKRVIHEIWDDLKSPQVMNRLLQGDVGSGKTVVALLTASIAIGNGFQAALMAPTEILAEQHYRVLSQLAAPAEIRVRLLIGGQAKGERTQILQEIKAGTAELVVGTHALIQEKVEFQRLALVIIDEQHRFGVLQRSQFIAKGFNPDVLVMTATPIPRTLSMTLYGDMDISILDELPARKGKIHTRLVTASQIDKVYQYIRDQVQKGRQAYIVYPLIEESEKVDLQAAIKGYEYLKARVFPEFKVDLLHGAMNTAEKEAVMRRFQEGITPILVSTTVIEVGVDNPNATIMLIENAERFGLTQLHQLRGRIGRGTLDGICILVERKRSELSHQRLSTILATTDGFEISEVDLKLRGPGEFYGVRQHGFPKMKIADLIEDSELLKIARRMAQQLIKEDPHLRRPENQPVREHLLANYQQYLDFVNVL